MRTRAVKRVRSPSGAVAATVTVFAPFTSPSTSNMCSGVSPSESASSPSSNTRGSTPMPTRLERWIRSKLLAITAATPRRRVPFAAQSREEPVPYSAPPNTTSGTPSAW